MRRRCFLAWAGLAAGPVALAGPAPARDAVVREWQLMQGSIAAPLRLLKVLKGDSVRLRIASDLPGDLHLHAYRLIARLVPGQATELNFEAHSTGRFRFEWHPADARAAGGEAHHAPPVAVMEVRPR